MNTPWYQSRKVVAALVTAVCALLAAAFPKIAGIADDPQTQAILAGVLASIVGAIGHKYIDANAKVDAAVTPVAMATAAERALRQTSEGQTVSTQKPSDPPSAS